MKRQKNDGFKRMNRLYIAILLGFLLTKSNPLVAANIEVAPVLESLQILSPRAVLPKQMSNCAVYRRPTRAIVVGCAIADPAEEAKFIQAFSSLVRLKNKIPSLTNLVNERENQHLYLPSARARTYFHIPDAGIEEVIRNNWLNTNLVKNLRGLPPGNGTDNVARVPVDVVQDILRAYLAEVQRNVIDYLINQ